MSVAPANQHAWARIFFCSLELSGCYAILTCVNVSLQLVIWGFNRDRIRLSAVKVGSSSGRGETLPWRTPELLLRIRGSQVSFAYGKNYIVFGAPDSERQVSD
jgi:hypothetical protein